MKIICISDLHGNLDFSIPEADLLLIAGDICPSHHSCDDSIEMQLHWLDVFFRCWLSNQPVKEVVAVAGNHDWVWEAAKNRIPKMNTNFHYLENESIEIFGKKIYGTPVQLPFNDWAFNKNKEAIQKYWNNIPEDVDILLLHSPPYGIMDKTDMLCPVLIGSKSLSKKIKEIKPRFVVFGHNHGDHGVIQEDDIIYINASLVDEYNDLTKKPIILEV